jgi:hypothetical protein
MKKLIATSLILITALVGFSDVLELKDGSVLDGSYRGGTAATLRFETTDGVQVIPTAEILALTFTGKTATAASSPPLVAAPIAPARTTTVSDVSEVTVPAGTVFNIRTSQVLTSDRAKARDKFTGRLEANLVVGDVVVAPRNTQIYGTVVSASQARRIRGQSTLAITLTEIQINGVMHKIVTDTMGQTGERAGKDIVRGAATGAAIGAVADGSSGAQDGAGWGAVAGGLKRGQSIYIPTNTLLQFNTTAAFQLPVAKR